MSTWLVAKDGSTHCAVATWNGALAAPPDAFGVAYRGLVRALQSP
jgi:hypothetical protein